MIRLALLLSVSTLVQAGCSGAPERAGVPPVSQGDVAFQLERTEYDEERNTIVGYFSFQNHADGSLSLPGLFRHPPARGSFRPHYVGYEFKRGNSWRSLVTEYCGIPEMATVESGEQLTLLIDLFRVRHLPPETPLRVWVGDYVSDEFTLSPDETIE